MSIARSIHWEADDVFLNASGVSTTSLAEDVYGRTCRTDHSAPGFCLVDVGRTADSVSMRQLMFDLREALSDLHNATAGKELEYLSMGRFDQQNSTRLHLDGGPEECLLMLGYEPSDVPSQIEMADYARCAFDHGISPAEFMERHNPMFQAGAEMLRPYCVPLHAFDSHRFQIMCVNNSRAPLDPKNRRWQGVLHTATINAPNPSKRRVINSTMIAPQSDDSPPAIDELIQREFLTTSRVVRRGYDTPDARDDA